MKFTEDVAPWLGVTGSSLVNIDSNEEGADDTVGALLSFVAEAGAAIEANETLPEIPQILTSRKKFKITGTLRTIITGVIPVLAFAQFRLQNPKVKKLIRYSTETLTALLKGSELPQPLF